MKTRILVTFKDLEKGDKFWDEGGRFTVVEKPVHSKGKVFLVCDNVRNTTVRFEIPHYYRLPKNRQESYYGGKKPVDCLN